MSVVRFVAKYCSQAKFFIKMDSDMYLMVDRVVGKLSSLSLEAIYGNYKIKSEVVRNGKYAVDKRDYPEDTYPTYHAGIYFIPANASLLLYRALVTTPHIGIIPALPFEDAYVSGILPERMNIPRKKFSGMVHLRPDNRQTDPNLYRNATVIFDNIDSNLMVCFNNTYGKFGPFV